MSRAERLAELERHTAQMLRAVMKGYRASEVIAMHYACEALTCAIQSSHRARSQRGLPKHLLKKIERVHAQLIKTVMIVGSELSRSISETGKEA